MMGLHTMLHCTDVVCFTMILQWNLQIKDTLGAKLLSSFQRLSFRDRFEPICNL